MLYVGIGAYSICILKIFIFDKFKFSFIDVIFKFIYSFSEKASQDVKESVLEEKNFVLNKANYKNSKIIIKNIDKKYFSIFKKRNIYAVKDVNLSLRTNEVMILYYLVFMSVR